MEPIDYEALAKLGIYGFEIHWGVGIHGGIAHAKSEDEAIEVGRFLVERAQELDCHYDITVYEHFMRKWIHAWSSAKERVANPKHCVFVVIGGTDCDGMRWCSYYSFKHLAEAAECIEDSLANADGPTSYTTLSRDSFEQGGYPDTRDRFAEAAGY